MNDVLLLVLVLACSVLAMTQMANLGAGALGLVSLILGISLIALGPLASHTSLAALGQWLALPQRRLDLAAVLLVEVLVYSQQALVATQGYSPRHARILGLIPPPSLWIALFLGMVWTMLEIDGIDLMTLAWACAFVFPTILLGGAVLLRRLLPDPLMRTGLRLCLHAAQLIAGVWLARPIQQAMQFPTPAMWDQLALLGVIVLSAMALGWCWQRRFFHF